MRIPYHWDTDNATIILHNGSRLAIHASGEMKLEGCIKDAALGLVKYVVEKEFRDGSNYILINRAISITKTEIFIIAYEGEQKPEFWDELSSEFDRIIKMRAFW